MSRKKKGPVVKVTWAQAFRDIVIAAINRGQLPLLSLVAIVFLLLWKMPPGDASKLVFDIWDELKSGAVLGWGLWVLTLGGSFFFGKRLRRLHLEECDRVGREKTRLQKKELERLKK